MRNSELQFPLAICLGWALSAVVSTEDLKIGVLLKTTNNSTQSSVQGLTNTCLRTLRSGNISDPEVTLFWRYTNETNVLRVTGEVCNLVNGGIDGLITGLSDCRFQAVLYTQADALRLPHLSVSREPCKCTDTGLYSVHLTQSHALRTSLLKDVIIYTGWTSVGLVFDESIGFTEQKDVIFILSSIEVDSTIVVISHLNSDSEQTRKMEHLKRKGISQIIVWTSTSTVPLVFARALGLKMGGSGYRWMTFNGASSVGHLLRALHYKTPRNTLIITQSYDFISSEPCLKQAQKLEDAEMAVSNGILDAVVRLLSLTHTDWKKHHSSLSCVEGNWNTRENNATEMHHGLSANAIKSLLKDDSMDSTEYNLHSLKADQSPSVVFVGQWRRSSGLNITSNVGLFVNRFRDFKGQYIRVTAKEELPFVIKKTDGTYTGLAFDILNELKDRLNFRYVVIEPEDRRYGAPNEDGTWNGLVGMVKRQEVMLGIGPFSITALRDTVIDYTKPYMDDSIGILTRRQPQTANLFQMMRPFSTRVWICILAVVILGGVLLTIINRLTPYGVRHPEDSFVTDEHSLLENLWIIYVSVMEQGAVYMPAANSSRCVLGFWWIFTILIVSTYTANLAAFLTVADPEPTINSLSALLQQQDLGVLVQDGSNLWSLFKDSQTPIYQEVWKRLQDSPSVDGLDAALPYVKTGKYVYVGDKSTLEYVAAKECQTYRVADESFNAGTYGFVMPENSIFKEGMDHYIMKMLEAGLVDNWRQKWWAKQYNCTKIAGAGGSASELSLNTLGGVFIVYIACVVCATLLLLLSMLKSSHCRVSCRTKKHPDPNMNKTAEQNEY